MFAELTDVRCYYELLGTGEPLVLLSGLGATRTLWDCVATDLARSFCLILPDNRGMGRSVLKRAPRTLADFAGDLAELMDHLQLDRVHVMGLSLGGMIAQHFAIDHPSRVDRLVLVSCTNRFGPYLREVARLLAGALRHFPKELFRRTVELLGTSPEYLDAHAEEVEQKIAAARELALPRLAIAKQLRCLSRHDADEEQKYQIVAPTLVIAGEQDMLIPACYARKMAQQIPVSEFMLVPECGHNPFAEKADVVVPRIREFLMRTHTGDGRYRQEDQLATETAVSSMG